MELTNRIFRTSTLLLVIFILLLIQACTDQKSLPLTSFNNQNDYSFMWWKKTIKTGNQVFAIKTSNYSLSFDYPHLAIESLLINKETGPADAVLRETNEESIPEQMPCKLDFGLKINGETNWCTTTSGRDDDCQLVETGRYFQRRFINNLPEMKGCDPFNSGLVISSWPDRLSFILKAVLAEDQENIGLMTAVTFPETYNTMQEKDGIIALKNPGDGSGFIVMKSEDATTLSVEGTKVTAKLEKDKKYPKGSELNSGMIIYPVSGGIDSKIAQIAEQENRALQVKAEQIAPLAHPLEVRYDKDMGWHQIVLRTDNTKSDKPAADPNEGNPGPQDDLNNRMERVVFSVENPSDYDRVVRLNFAKGRLTEGGSAVFAIPGISAVLRDLEGNPVGIPVQLSKNWHSGGRSGVKNHRFEGAWYHGLSVITVPAKTKIELEYTSVNALWGGVPAASHAQLCLIGWGSNQQWDEAAIGAWGENITYEPDLDQASAPVLDFRALMVKNSSGKKWGWTGNLGGADIFNYTKTNGQRGWHSRIRTQYKRYSPNFTEVTYAGTMDDNTMDFEYTASLGRSDDITRGIYKIKLNVLKNTAFNDFVVFQGAAATYHYTKSNTLAWGNETGLIKEWDASIGGKSRYIMPKQVAEGKVPWFAFTNSEYSPFRQKGFLSANRGIVIREWKARINGRDNTPPWFSEYMSVSGDHGGPSSLVNITPPGDCTSFQAGDYIEAEIEFFIVPQHTGDYYGPNQNLENALETKANSWELVYREAIGNDLAVDVAAGSLLDRYPIKIKAENNEAQFSVTGGCGYVPLTITNLSQYQNPKLFRKVNDSWQKVDQSVHGNDFWQCDYDALTGTWDITYNINLDTPGDKRQTAEFRLDMK